ncbi:MAG: apolipoprotein N-acyltransferase [Acidobacteria bacterium]|nr:MAG: apolipoprotein N-acyltransferase [Acidobacteriota bacterium]
MIRLRGDGLALLSGVLLALSFPKFGRAPVAWIALAPLLVALARAPGPAHGFRLGYLTGAVSSLGIVYWTATVVVQYGGLRLGVGIVVMAMLCLALALFPSIFGLLVTAWVRALGPRGLLLSPLAWVASEILRANTLCNFSWCLLGYSQQPHPGFIQLARYTAVYGVSFLLAGVSAVLAYLAVEKRAGPRWTAALAAAVVVSAVWIHGVWLLGQPWPEAGRISVGLVQASILQENKWDPGHALENVQRHVELTRRAAARGARLVVWPESAVPFSFDDTPAVAEELRGLARDSSAYLLFGNDDRQDLPYGPYRVWVAAKMLTPRGDLPLRYHKIRLVPFGEYVPLQPVLTLGGRFTARLVQQVADFTPGEEYGVAEVDGHPLAAFICYEAIFPDLVRQFTRRGAELLVNITNDAWYGYSSAPYQHMAMAAFRAVENEKYLVRAANTGITAVVDPRGRIVERTELFRPAVLVREVAFVPGNTFYARHGDVFAWGCLAAAAAITAATLRRRRR